MEKHGVCEGEGEAPKPSEKKAADATKVGGDLQSRMAEQAADRDRAGRKARIAARDADS